MGIKKRSNAASVMADSSVEQSNYIIAESNIQTQSEKPIVMTRESLKHWSDLWFNKHKKTGYVAITDLKQQLFYGSNDVQKIIAQTEGRRKQFISINAFDINWEEKIFSRKTELLKQIRNVAIDIDQYNLGLTIDQALNEIHFLVISNIIPEPNLVLSSRGIQLFYSIEKGASPEMAWLVSYITDQLISKLQAVGADSNAKDMSRVMRVPNSVNERNGATVQPAIWNDVAYTLQELQAYCRPLEQFETRRKKKGNIVQFPTNKRLSLFYITNYARLSDLKRLIELREGDFTGMRNVFLYMFSYHQSLVLNTQKDVIASVRNAFTDVYSSKDKSMSKREFERTVKSAYEDAGRFFKHFSDNGYQVIYKTNDGIVKPYKTTNIIVKLSITESEQYMLRTLRNADIARVQDKERKRSERRAVGVKERSAYETDRKDRVANKVTKLANLVEQHPGATQRELSHLMGVSLSTLKRYLQIVNR